MDAEKAYDIIWHNGLLYKTIKLKFLTSLIKTASSFLTEITISVFIWREILKTKEIKNSIPHGDLTHIRIHIKETTVIFGQLEKNLNKKKTQA